MIPIEGSYDPVIIKYTCLPRKFKIGKCVLVFTFLQMDDDKMRLALICNEELVHSPQIASIEDYFCERVDHKLYVMPRNDLHHDRLKDIGIYFVMGGDGTLFTLTHYLRKGFIVGIHADQDKSVGHFMGLSLARERLRGEGCLQEKMVSLVEGIASNSGFVKSVFGLYYRLKGHIRKATGITVPVDMAFNEYALGNNLFGRPSKYRLSVLTTGSSPPAREWQRSSGVICSTMQGISGWVRHILPQDRYDEVMAAYSIKMNQTVPELFYIVREPMNDAVLESGFATQLVIESDTAGGIVSLDGFNEVPFERNDEVVIEVSTHPLWLLRKNIDFSRFH